LRERDPLSAKGNCNYTEHERREEIAREDARAAPYRDPGRKDGRRGKNRVSTKNSPRKEGDRTLRFAGREGGIEAVSHEKISVGDDVKKKKVGGGGCNGVPTSRREMELLQAHLQPGRGGGGGQ